MASLIAGIDDLYLALIGFYLAIMIFLVVRYLRSRGKYTVRIHKPLAIQVEHVKPDGNKLPIVKARGKRAEWAPKFTNGCLYQYSNNIFWFIPRKSWAVDVKEDAEDCIDWSQNNPNPPTLTKDQVKEYSEAQALRQMGKGTKLELPTVFWLTVIGSMGSLILLVIIANRMGLF